MEKFNFIFSTEPYPGLIYADVREADGKGWERKELAVLQEGEEDEIEETMGGTQRSQMGRRSTGSLLPLTARVLDKMKRYGPSGAVRYYDCVLDGYFHGDVTLINFRDGWDNLMFKPGAPITDPAVRPYSIFGLESAAPSGPVAVSVPSIHPKLRLPGIYVRPNHSGKPRLTTDITPIGQITKPQIAGTGTGASVLELFGHKVFVAWEPTPANLGWMERSTYGAKSGSMVLWAIEEMEEMSVAILWPGEGVWVKPGTIHATLALSMWAVTRWEYVDLEWFTDGTVERLMNWKVGILKSKIKDWMAAWTRFENGKSDSPYDVARVLKVEMEVWRAGAEKFGREIQNRVIEFINHLEAVVDELVSEFGDFLESIDLK